MRLKREQVEGERKQLSERGEEGGEGVPVCKTNDEADAVDRFPRIGFFVLWFNTFCMLSVCAFDGGNITARITDWRSGRMR